MQDIFVTPINWEHQKQFTEQIQAESINCDKVIKGRKIQPVTAVLHQAVSRWLEQVF